jgi:hypothetical protein
MNKVKNVWFTKNSAIADLSWLLLVNELLFVSVSSSRFIPAYYAAEYLNLSESQAPKMEAACFSERLIVDCRLVSRSRGYHPVSA